MAARGANKAWASGHARLCIRPTDVPPLATSNSPEFTAYLFLITLYPDTFLPASALGLSITVATVLASKAIGQQVDTQPRFSFVRRLILVQKVRGKRRGEWGKKLNDRSCVCGQLSQAGCYAIFLYLFSPTASSSTDESVHAVSWPSVGLLVILASVGRIATTGIDLAVCRDWILSIASDRHDDDTGPSSSRTDQPNELLTFLTTSLRRITLLCKLLAPLLISVLTTSTGNRATAGILLGMAGLTLAPEMLWIGVVWRQFEGVLGLGRDQAPRARIRAAADDETIGNETVEPGGAVALAGLDEPGDEDCVIPRIREDQTSLRTWVASAARTIAPWNEFRKMPIFLSECLGE